MSDTTRMVGVVGTSQKENERRVPIHPRHIAEIPAARRSCLRFEQGYGVPFGISDDALRALGAGVVSREQLVQESAVLILPKPTVEDFRQIREGTVIWGWPHCVQQRELTQWAIDRRFTLIAWEAMFQWSRNGTRGPHVFARNNELAGYCGVLHALALQGIDGAYGPAKSVAILGFGSVSRGAAFALRGRGFENLTFYTQRPPHLVRDRQFGARHRQMRRGSESEGLQVRDPDGGHRPLIEALVEADLIVNGTLQDTDAPLMFCRQGEEGRLGAGTLIIDVSCDRGMGFPFARPTSFEDPTFEIEGVTYYAVDHTPTYLWNAASWEISRALLPYLASVMDGPEGWAANETVQRAIEIRDGHILNPKILSFQHRAPEYPHVVT